MNTTITGIKSGHWLARKFPYFYGYIILPISTIAAVFTSPGQTLMVSVFNPTFRNTLDISLTQLTGAYMLGTFLASLPQSYIGHWADRIGIRKMLFIVVSAFSLACVFIAQVNSLVILFFAFFFLRLLGQGALELLSVNMLPMWFRSRLGTISGFKNVAVNLLIGVIPLVALMLINKVGWRNTYILSGIIVFVVMMPLAYFFYINRPEDIGQELDGGSTQDNPGVSALDTQVSDNNYSLKEAMHTRSYWILAMTWFTWAAVATAITFNILPIFTSKGLTEEQAAASFTILMISSAIFQFLGGYLADRIQLRFITFGALAFYGVAVGAVIFIPTSAVILVYMLILGLAQGLFGGLGNTVWVRYFGRENLGKIRGSIWTAAVAGSSVGPFLMGLSYDQSGSFYFSLLSIAVILFGLAVAGLWATPPAKPFISKQQT